MIGAAATPPLVARLEQWMLTFALLRFTLIPMAAIAVPLLGAGQRIKETLFLDWFGPRGLASIQFVLLDWDEQELLLDYPALMTIVLMVALSATARSQCRSTGKV